MELAISAVQSSDGFSRVELHLAIQETQDYSCSQQLAVLKKIRRWAWNIDLDRPSRLIVVSCNAADTNVVRDGCPTSKERVRGGAHVTCTDSGPSTALKADTQSHLLVLGSDASQESLVSACLCTQSHLLVLESDASREIHVSACLGALEEALWSAELRFVCCRSVL